MSIKKIETNPQIIEVVNTTNELDIVVNTAKAYPRNITFTLQEIKSMINPTVAKTLWYSLPRQGKIIEGPSIRLAELFQNSWGNLRIQSRIREITQTYVVAECVVYDVEKNTMLSTEVRKRIIDKNGNRYSEDMVITTSNAAIAIARRNAIFSIIPRAFVDEMMGYAKTILHSHPETKTIPLKTRWDKLIEDFKNTFNWDKKKVYEKLNIKSDDQVNEAVYNTAIGLFNSISEGLFDEEEQKNE